MVNIKKIIEKGGETLTSNLKVANIAGGYMVSILGYEKTFEYNDTKNINDYILNLQDKIKDKKGYFIGLWTYENKLYIDVSINIIDKVDALEFGKKNKQISIYNIENGNTIDINDYKFITYYTLYKKLDNGDYIVLKQTEQLEVMIEYLKNYNINYSYKVLTNKCCLSIEDNKNIGSDGRFKIVKDYAVINEVVWLTTFFYCMED